MRNGDDPSSSPERWLNYRGFGIDDELQSVPNTLKMNYWLDLFTGETWDELSDDLALRHH
jgi:hypothetical protein